MRYYILKGSLLVAGMVLLCSSSLTFAGWQLAKPHNNVPTDPFFQAGTQKQKHAMPSSYAAKSFPDQYATLGQPAPVYAVSISGSLKQNVERIMSRYHWKVVWKAPYDYNFDGKVTGSSLANVVEKLLDPFPLRAEMYMANKTIAIYPRA